MLSVYFQFNIYSETYYLQRYGNLHMLPNPTTLPMQARVNSTLFAQVSLISVSSPGLLVLVPTTSGSSPTTFFPPIFSPRSRTYTAVLIADLLFSLRLYNNYMKTNSLNLKCRHDYGTRLYNAQCKLLLKNSADSVAGKPRLTCKLTHSVT